MSKPLYIIFLAAWVLVQYAGCGVKGPPIPSGYVKPARVDDLRYQISQDTITLYWTIPEGAQKPTYGIAGAKVYRLKTSLDTDVCLDCPLTFGLVESIPSKSGAVQYRETLERGFQYTYKVVVYDETNQESEDSNIVQFTYD